MNAQDYIAAGYNFSAFIEQSAISRAEDDALTAYILPVYPNAKEELQTNDTLRKAVMSFAALLVAQRSVSNTRAGAKTKQTNESMTPTAIDILRQYSATCAMRMREVRALEGAKKDAKINDICGIYFKSNYFYK